jgi:hypothetical protein
MYILLRMLLPSVWHPVFCLNIEISEEGVGFIFEVDKWEAVQDKILR